jgi:MYXO-CTERM domain-containing protein
VHSIGEVEIMKGNVRIDNNLYYGNGYEPWPQHTPGMMAGDVTGSGYQELPTLAEVRSTLKQEASGVEGDPVLAGYDSSVTDGRWQDFRLTAASALAIDKGVALPASLLALLAKFGIDPGQKGAALDLGAMEYDPANPNDPQVIDVGPRDGGTGEAGAPWPIPAAGDGGTTVPAGNGGTSGGGCGCSLAGEHDRSVWGEWWLAALVAALAGCRWQVRQRSPGV